MTDATLHFFRIKRAAGAAWCGLKLWHEAEQWHAEVNGESVPVEDVTIEFASTPDALPYVKGETITEAEYIFLTERFLWAKHNDPQSPWANPRKRIDMNALKPIKFNT